jgi:hypothetical protein
VISNPLINTLRIDCMRDLDQTEPLPFHRGS